MRQVAKKGLITFAAAGGVLALSGGSAFADAGAHGGTDNSPGVLSGNNVQVPVDVPVNVCGNTVNVVGLLNPAMGNECVNDSSSHKHGGHHKGGHKGGDQHNGGHEGGHNGGHDGGHEGGHNGGHHGGHDGGGAQADGGASHSPGVGSGNNAQAPIHVPVNACGNSIDVVGLLNPAMGNECVNDSSHTSHVPPEHKTPEPKTPDHEHPGHPDENKPEEDTTKPAPETQTVPDRATHAQLAQTGAGSDLGLGIGASAGLLLGGAVLYRRARVAQQR